MVFLMLQRMEHQNEGLKNQLTDLHSRVEAIGAFCVEGWKPSKEQVVSVSSTICVLITDGSPRNCSSPYSATTLFDPLPRTLT
jgi:hypothetical protein